LAIRALALARPAPPELLCAAADQVPSASSSRTARTFTAPLTSAEVGCQGVVRGSAAAAVADGLAGRLGGAGVLGVGGLVEDPAELGAAALPDPAVQPATADAAAPASPARNSRRSIKSRFT
jgi:hypothetical protein